MAIPQGSQAVWERESVDGDEVRTATGRPKRHFTRSAPWLGIVVIVVLFFYTMLQSMVSIFTGSAPTAAFHLSICSSTSVGTRLGSDLLSAFLARSGAQSVHVSGDTALTKISARLPGHITPTILQMHSKDSAFAFDSLAGGECNVALIGREINPLEIARFHKPPAASLIALDGAVLVVNPANPLRSVSNDDMRSIFSGTATNWAQVGGRRGKITTVMPPRHSDEFSVFVEHVMHGRLPEAESRHSESVADTVAAPENPNAVGLTTFHASDPARILLQRSPSGDIPASTVTIGRRTYPLVLPIYAYRDEATMTPTAYQFLSFLNSEEGQNIIVADGFVSPASF
jgi:phosphate transport system substrate-binding protein